MSHDFASSCHLVASVIERRAILSLRPKAKLEKLDPKKLQLRCSDTGVYIADSDQIEMRYYRRFDPDLIYRCMQ